MNLLHRSQTKLLETGPTGLLQLSSGQLGLPAVKHEQKQSEIKPT